jgi:hypothetical protein
MEGFIIIMRPINNFFLKRNMSAMIIYNRSKIKVDHEEKILLTSRVLMPNRML